MEDPMGGTAILYNRALTNSIEHVYNCNYRITAILLATNNGKILWINVYICLQTMVLMKAWSPYN